VFPTDNSWNVNIRNAPLNSRSAQIVAYIQAHGGKKLHPDFGENQTYGIPVRRRAPEPAAGADHLHRLRRRERPGPFPVPLNAPVEAGSDAHVLVVRQGTCDLFELYGAHRTTNGWAAASGARFDLTSNALRPLGWTSADAAGLPITPGLVRYEEVASGHIDTRSA